jgi:PPE-repeat protein
MYGYAGASAAASALLPFSPPPRTTNVAGMAAQHAAVTEAASTAAQTTASTTAPAVPQTLQQLSSAATSTSSVDSSTLPSWLVGPNGLISTLFGAAGGSPTINNGTWNALTYDVSQGGLGTTSSLLAVAAGLAPGAPAASPALGGALPPPGAVGGAWGSLGLGGGAPVSASAGQADAIGRLSVPPSWAAASSALSPEATAAMPVNNIGAATGGAPSGLLRGIPLTCTGGLGSGGFTHKYGFRYSVMPRPPAAG